MCASYVDWYPLESAVLCMCCIRMIRHAAFGKTADLLYSIKGSFERHK
ncbi:hypothetical protein HMPREF1584_00398 [Gardnerella vaginalis JCP8481A]|nr:hypothetical protein HMPREF1584_00398 [Gardnerella vaginalis JCP8481A]